MFGIIAALIVVILLISLFSFFFNEEARTKRALKQTPVSSFTTFKDGQIGKIVGQVILKDKALISPLTQQECAGYHVIVQEERESTHKDADGDEHTSTEWHTIIEEKLISDFLLKNAEGIALVRSRGNNTAINKEHQFKSGIFNDSTPTLEAFLNKHGEKSTTFFGNNKTLRYVEGLLEEGEKVAVLGKGKWLYHLPELHAHHKVLEIYADKEQRLFISDKFSTFTN